jgi:Putative phage metallopeptidase
MSKYQKYEVIETGTEPYNVLTEARELWHTDLDAAAIALAWEGKVKMDIDGHVRLGKCVKVTDLYREFAEFNFIIVLNREVWGDEQFTAEKKLALMDHELCHAAPAYDEDTGKQKVDAANRLVWRVRRHDIEEFRSVVAHHGCYKADLEKFAKTLLQKQGELVLERAPLAATFNESSIEEINREKRRKTKARLQGQDAILPDKRKPADAPAEPEQPGAPA